MIKTIVKYIRFLIVFLFLFATYWFLNSGFLANPLWLPVQAGFFAMISFFIFKYRRLKLILWFIVVGFFYIASSLFEIFQFPDLSVIAASTGFGVLVILIVSQVFKKVMNNVGN